MPKLFNISNAFNRSNTVPDMQADDSLQLVKMNRTQSGDLQMKEDYTNLEYRIKNNSIASPIEFESVISDNPDLLLYITKEGESLLSHILEYGSHQKVMIFLDYLADFKGGPLKKILRARNLKGWSPLHRAARFQNAEVLTILIDLYEEDIYEAVSEVNEKIQLPLDLLQENENADLSMNEALTSLMYESGYTLQNPHAPLVLSEVLTEAQTQAGIGTLLSAELLNNLTLGFHAAVRARAVMKLSISDLNKEYLLDYPLELESLTQKRDELLFYRISLPSVHCDMTAENNLLNIVNDIKKNNVGSPKEYAYLVLDALFKLGVETPAEIFELSNGGNTFVVLGGKMADRKKDREPVPYNAFDRDAVVIDAANGDIFPASQMAARLKDFNYKALLGTCFTPAFDPTFHKIAVFSEPYTIFKPEYFAKSRVPNYADFSEEEKAAIQHSLTHKKIFERNKEKLKMLCQPLFKSFKEDQMVTYATSKESLDKLTAAFLKRYAANPLAQEFVAQLEQELNLLLSAKKEATLLSTLKTLDNKKTAQSTLLQLVAAQDFSLKEITDIYESCQQLEFLNSHTNLRWDRAWNLKNTTSWRHTVMGLQDLACKKLAKYVAQELAGIDKMQSLGKNQEVDAKIQQLRLELDRLKNLDFFKVQNSNYFLTGNFRRPTALVKIDEHLAALSQREPQVTVSSNRLGFKVNIGS